MALLALPNQPTSFAVPAPARRKLPQLKLHRGIGINDKKRAGIPWPPIKSPRDTRKLTQPPFNFTVVPAFTPRIVVVDDRRPVLGKSKCFKRRIPF